MNKLIPVLAATVLLTGCESMYTEDPYTGERQMKKSVKYGAIAAATCAAGAAITADGHKTDKAAIGAAACGAAGAGVGHYFDTQEEKLRQQLRGTGVSIYRDGDVLRLIMPGNITFGSDSSDINSNFYQVLNSVALVLKEYDKTAIEVVGYTDSTGSFEYNQSLSERRASSVANYLASQGIFRSRLNTYGMGPRNPIASNDSPQGRSQNRRVELTIRPMQG